MIINLSKIQKLFVMIQIQRILSISFRIIVGQCMECQGQLQLLNHRNWPIMELTIDQLDTMIGEGANGWIYSVKCQPHLAVKISKKYSPQFQREVNILQRMIECDIFPKIISYGTLSTCSNNNDPTNQQLSYIVMERLGMSLQQLMIIRKGKLSIITIKTIGKQMVKQLRQLHQRNIIHNDIKPANILFGMKEKRKQAYLIDFGLAQDLSIQQLNCRGYEQEYSFKGNVKFASVNKLKGRPSSQADDIESLIYVLLWLANGCQCIWENLNNQIDELIEESTIFQKIRTNINRKQTFANQINENQSLQSNSTTLCDNLHKYLFNLHNHHFSSHSYTLLETLLS